MSQHDSEHDPPRSTTRAPRFVDATQIKTYVWCALVATRVVSLRARMNRFLGDARVSRVMSLGKPLSKAVWIPRRDLTLRSWIDRVSLGVVAGGFVAMIAPLLPRFGTRDIGEGEFSWLQEIIAVPALWPAGLQFLAYTILMALMLGGLRRLGTLRLMHLRMRNLYLAPPLTVAIPIAALVFEFLRRRSLPMRKPDDASSLEIQVQLFLCAFLLVSLTELPLLWREMKSWKASWRVTPAAENREKKTPRLSELFSVQYPASTTPELAHARQSFFDRWLESETPASTIDDDVLETSGVARRIAIRLHDRKMPRIALIGEQGSGKSTIINFVEEFLRNPGDELELLEQRSLIAGMKRRPQIIICRVSAWGIAAHSAAAVVLSSVIDELSERIDVLAISGLPKAYQEAMGDLNAFGKLLGGILGETSPAELIKSLDRLLSPINVRLVIAIEDLDRNQDFMAATEGPATVAMPPEVRTSETTDVDTDAAVTPLAQMSTFVMRSSNRLREEVESLLDQLRALRQVTFLLPLASTGALDPTLARFCEYFEFCPSLAKNQVLFVVYQLFDTLYPESNVADDDARLEIIAWKPKQPIQVDQKFPKLKAAVAALLANPRHLKSVLRATNSMWRALRDEVNVVDLFLSQVLKEFSPTLWHHFFASLAYLADYSASVIGERSPLTPEEVEAALREAHDVPDVYRANVRVVAIYLLLPGQLKKEPDFDARTQASRVQMATEASYRQRIALESVDAADQDKPVASFLRDCAAPGLAEARKTLINEMVDLIQNTSETQVSSPWLLGQEELSRFAKCWAVFSASEKQILGPLVERRSSDPGMWRSLGRIVRGESEWQPSVIRQAIRAVFLADECKPSDEWVQNAKNLDAAYFITPFKHYRIGYSALAEVFWETAVDDLGKSLTRLAKWTARWNDESAVALEQAIRWWMWTLLLRDNLERHFSTEEAIADQYTIFDFILLKKCFKGLHIWLPGSQENDESLRLNEANIGWLIDKMRGLVAHNDENTLNGYAARLTLGRLLPLLLEKCDRDVASKIDGAIQEIKRVGHPGGSTLRKINESRGA